MIDLSRLAEYYNPEHSDIAFEQNRVVQKAHNKWTHRGHTFNEGMISPDGNYFYLNISKNNSSFVKKVLSDLDWQFASLEDYTYASVPPQVITILRDPVDRWISGVVEYLFLYHIDVIDRSGFFNPAFGYQAMMGQTLAMDLLFKNVTFDDHTERQCMFLQSVDLNRVIWFHAQNNFNLYFENFLRDIGYDCDLNKYDIINQDVDQENFSFHNKRRQMKKLFRSYLESVPDIKSEITRHFGCDYHLMESVKYYGT